MSNKKQIGYCLVLWLAILPLCGLAEEVLSLGEISSNLLGPVGLLANVGYKIFYVLGAGFILGSGLRYRAHRINPNEVRFGEVLFLLVLGVLLVLLPFIMNLSQGASILQDQ